MLLGAKGRRATLVCLAPEDHQGPPETLDKMAQEAILVMLDQEASPAQRDLKEILEDLASAFLDQGGHQEKKVRKETAAAVGAEATVGRRANLAKRGVQEKQASQDLTVNPVQEVYEERGAVLEILVLREIPVSQNVT